MQRLVEDAGETCLVARSGDEGMVERVWSLVEDAGETCLVARSGDEGMVERWLVYPPVTRVSPGREASVVSIPACHAGDPGSIPGREASFCSHLLFCSSALLLPPALLLFCSSALLLFCSSALLFFAALFPAVRAPQPTSLMLPTHSWRIGTSAAVESDSPTRTKIDTCTAPYSSWRIGTSAAVESDSPTRTKIDTCTAPYSHRCCVCRGHMVAR
ncbi:hypothetical protein P3T76_016378 [Phytophthora citrophthora]|uniref:Uncharacterized protein n=1 Tax=Phytophthora citrophthora TaxID=4793 RepID=A0AAD9L9H7_9STRA|nr:hypothetical protein P3T76_016378 [Phytophthora citrophthora]